MAQEVDSLNARVVEAETRLKSEVTKIKKKMTITITELELQIDTINKSNIDLQKLSKKQSIQLQVRRNSSNNFKKGLSRLCIPSIAIIIDKFFVLEKRSQINSKFS